MTDKKEGPGLLPEPEKPSGNGFIISPGAKESASKRLSWNTDYLVDWEAKTLIHGPFRLFPVPLRPAEQCDVIPRPPGFPSAMREEAFYGVAGEVVEIIEPKIEACREALLAQFLVAMGNLLGKGAYLDQGEGRHHLNEFLTLVGPTSSGRKGTSWQAIKNLCGKLDSKWLSERVVDGIQSGEAIIHEVRDPQSKTVKTGTGSRQEIDPGVTEKRLLLKEEEFARLLGVASRDGNALSPTLRQAWDGEKKMHVASKNSGEKATDPHISLIGHITKDELEAVWNTVESKNGFGNRILWCAARMVKKIPIPEKIDWDAYTDVIQHLSAIRDSFKGQREIRFSESGRIAWDHFYMGVSDNVTGVTGKLLGRTEAHVLRLFMTYAVLDNHDPCLIEPEHIQAAIAVWDYCSASVRYVFGGPSGGPVKRLDSNTE